MNKFVVIALVILLVASGCMQSHKAVLAKGDSGQSLTLTWTAKGILMGPCMPYPGNIKQQVWIQLVGSGPTYTPDNIQFVNAQGQLQPLKDLKGEVHVDESSGLATVNFTWSDGRAFYLNGRYKLST
jgi:hypothetical protein